MKIKKEFIFFTICYFNVLIFCAQNDVYKTINFFKSYQLDSVKSILDQKKNSFSNHVFEKEYEYLKNGNNLYIDSFSALNYIDSVLYFNYLGNYHLRKLKTNEALAFKNFKTALVIAKRKKDTLLINQTLLNINLFFKDNNKDSEVYKLYMLALDKYKRDEIDFFWATYFNVFFDMKYSKYTKEKFKNLEKKYITILQNTPKNSYFVGFINHTISIFYSYTGQKNLVRKYNKEALLTYNNTAYYSRLRKVKTKINIAIDEYDDKKYKIAISKFKNLLTNKIVGKELQLKYDLFLWIYKTYDTLKMSDSALYYFKRSNQTQKELKKQIYAESIRDTDVKYKVIETKKKLKKETLKNKKLVTKMNTILPILAIITLLLGLVFILYKKYYKKTEVLEEEKSEVVKKIDKLTEIVIKNHIVLKDKTKVYVADLMYIKSDDHFLKVFLSNGKNHFVRGRLYKIVEELPPNFIRCHRSYVINRNFIKQVNNTHIILVDKTEIPLARAYKDKF